MSSDGHDIDVAAMRRAFDRASAGYDASAVLQARVRERLLARLDWIAFEPAVVADLGCGTGQAAAALCRRWPQAQVLAVDLSPGMLAVAGGVAAPGGGFARVCADALRLPLPEASVDLLFSNLMLQWCDDLDAAFAEFRRVLKPRGLLSFTTFGPDTLAELRAAWGEADDYTHVSPFADMHDIGDGLVRAGLVEPVMDVERYTLTYPDLRALMHDLKAIGAQNATTGRPRGLTGRRRLRAVEQAYEGFRRDGSLPAGYEVVYGQAWGPAGAAGRRSDGAFAVPVASIGRRGRLP